MGTASIQKGSAVFINNSPHILKRLIDDNFWQVEEEKTGRIKEFAISQLQQLYKNGELLFVDDSKIDVLSSTHMVSQKRNTVASLSTSKSEWNRIKVIRQYVKAVADCVTSAKIMSPEIQKVWKKIGSHGKPPHWITVVRWRQKYLNAGEDINSLVTKTKAMGNRVRRYPKEVLHFVDEAVDRIYLTLERKTIEDTLDHAIEMVARENNLRPDGTKLPEPTRRLIRKAIESFPMFDRHAARYGRMAATKMYRTALNKQVTKRVLERAEIDHTKLDLFVIDDETGMPWGRPWVTVCIDSFSRCVLGIYVGFEPPSFLSVARCLRQAFMPKIDLRNDFPDTTNTWDAHGVMETLVVDNGLEFHSESLESVCYSLGIDILYMPRKTPWWKGIVERFIGTMNRGVAHGNPGTTFSNILEKDDYNPSEHAIITFDTLKTILNKWVVDVYHQRPHRSLDGITPAVMWSSSIKVEDINLPDDPARLDAIMGKVVSRTLTHKGIEYEKLRYNSPELAALRRRLGDKLDVELRINEGDLGHIYVIAPDKSDYFKVPCLNLEYANGLTLWQHNVCKRYKSQNFKIDDTPNSWRRAKVEISEIIMRDVLHKKGKSRSKSARFMNVGQPTPEPNMPNTRNVLTHKSIKAQPISTIASPIESQLTHRTSVYHPRPKFEALIENRVANVTNTNN